MLSPLIHYELDMAHQYQGQLRREAALWDAARQAARSARAHRFGPGQLQTAVMLVVILVGVGASAIQLVHW